MKTLFCTVAASLIVVGCGGGGGSSGSIEPAAAKPTDIWEGATYDSLEDERSTTCVVTPGSEFYCFDENGGLLWGRTGVDEKTSEVLGNVDWASPIVVARGAERVGRGSMTCELMPHEMIECAVVPETEDVVAHAKSAAGGTVDAQKFRAWGPRMMLFHKDLDPNTHSCYIRDYVLQAEVGGAWAPWGQEGGMLYIDRSGRAFSQDPKTGCFLNGTVIKYNPDTDDRGVDREKPYNLFKVDLLIEGCTADGYDDYNDRFIRGYAYLDRTLLDKDTLVVAARVRGPERYAAWVAQLRRQ